MPGATFRPVPTKPCAFSYWNRPISRSANWPQASPMRAKRCWPPWFLRQAGFVFHRRRRTRLVFDFFAGFRCGLLSDVAGCLANVWGRRHHRCRTCRAGAGGLLRPGSTVVGLPSVRMGFRRCGFLAHRKIRRSLGIALIIPLMAKRLSYMSFMRDVVYYSPFVACSKSSTIGRVRFVK